MCWSAKVLFYCFLSSEKKNYGKECYLLRGMCHAKRSIIAQFRLSIRPLKIETGRFQQLPVEDRTCNFCLGSEIEDEKHFLFDCCLYNSLRDTLFSRVCALYPEFSAFQIIDKIELLMIKTPDLLANFIFDAYNKRKEKMYNL